MKTLSKNLLDEVNTYMNTEARPLERALYNYHFNNVDEEEILDSLEKFQNTDGGFGQGIEPDYKLEDSSPMATSIGLRYLSKIDNNERAQKMISKAISYLEITFDKDRNGWFSVPKSVNNFPHAPWWEYKRDINMTIIDYSWGNPSTELIGYLYKYRELLTKIDIDPLLTFAINYFCKKKTFNSEHEIFCFIRLYNVLDGKYSSQLEKTLNLAVKELVNIDEDEWSSYVPTPLKFIEFDSMNFFGISKNHIDQNLDYLINKLEEDGKILPTWEWDNYLDYWKISKEEWMGVLTLEALLSLLKFNRISKE